LINPLYTAGGFLLPMFQFIYKHSKALLLFWVLFILFLCATPGQYIPSADWMEMLSVDKAVHAFIFFVLCALLLLRSFQLEKGDAVLVLYILAAILYGVSLEYMQAAFFSQRAFDYFDMLANTFGCLLAFSLKGPFYRRFATLSNSKE